jgi:hypothetical protein
MVGCTSDPCHKWMHEQCIKDDALKATFERLGTTKPHQSPNAVKQEKDDEEAKRPLSPTETGAGMSTQPSIDVKSSGDAGPTDGIQVNADNVEVKQADDEDAMTAPEDGPAQSTNTQDAGESSRPETPSKGTPKTSVGRKAGRPKRKGEANGDALKPWDGLFEVSLNMEVNPPKLEFKDLRDGIAGGEKTWTEPIRCLICGSEIN